MRIRTITSAEDAFSAWYETYHSAHVADHPTGPRYSERELRVIFDPSEHVDAKLWLAEEDARPVGAAKLGLPLRDNTALGEPEIWVRPEARRRGVGTALLETLEGAARENQRTSLLTYLEGPADASQTSGTRFFEKHGFTRRITEIARVQRPPFDLDAIAKAEDEARPHAEGYQIVAWRDRVPDDLVDEYARLEGRLSTDAPLGELDYQPEVWDEARIRKIEERAQRMGRSAWSAVAVSGDGTMAGLTRITVHQDSDEVGFQDTTLVDPGHRGHRLGLLLKAANFRQVLRDRPGIQAIWTWNADSNQQMISINETLGYRVEGWAAGYQRDV
ncbi:GNAT family N-acetyltransferase [Phytoactinopolyspora alkaliphila]|uniref:GNAT family N-acetyltransferase n=1 Tax=Phytoactinopolyspora alkaliphila TaxID=1783498 RepID=A0A6N9YH35_9ACTN|nr:GNAT family N-acetyltransferase [Phytoactinopolyspora alkaliphila]NED94371.1 GNAT family N-acetyltransferase [Phytoactinopolyspora alkaliphila]